MEDYKKYLKSQNLAKNTIVSYVNAVKLFCNISSDITKQSLLEFKGYLIENYKPKTVNLRIQAINKYLEYVKKKID